MSPKSCELSYTNVSTFINDDGVDGDDDDNNITDS